MKRKPKPSIWTVGETRLVAGVPHVVVVCFKCKEKMLVRTDAARLKRISFCMECAGLNRRTPGFGGVSYYHRSDSNYHGGYSE